MPGGSRCRNSALVNYEFLGWLLGIAIATGVLTGLTGASGMSVLISGLLLLGVDIREIIALTFVATLANGAASAIPYWRRGYGVARVLATVGIAACAGVIPGFFISSTVPKESLQWVMIVALFLAGVKLLVTRSAPTSGATVDEGGASGDTVHAKWIGEVLFGLAAGLVMGIMGGGGGVFIATVLILAFKMQAKEAIATSIGIMTLSAWPGLLLHAYSGNIPWKMAAVLIPVSMATAFAAARIGRQLPDVVIKRGLGAYLVIMMVVLMVRGT